MEKNLRKQTSTIDQIDLVAASLENALGGAGGFCCGKKYIVDHQRLSGLGYCFSASLPPMLAAGALQAFTIIENDTGLLLRLQENCQKINHGLSKIDGMKVCSDPRAPIQHFCLSEPNDSRDIDCHTLKKITELAMDKGVALTEARYLEHEEHSLPPPSIRVAVNVKLSSEEIDKVLSIISDVCQEVLLESSS